MAGNMQPAATVHALRDGPIGWLTFDNTAKRNAISPGMPDAAVEAIQAYAADPSVSVVIVRGAGEKAFVSGADIASFETGDDGERRESLDQMLAALASLAKPVIAMIHGYCLGAGMSIALRADLRFASTDALFGIPAAQRGVAYSPENIERVVRVVGPSVAKDLLYSARRMEADEALRTGLVNRVFSGTDLERETVAYATGLAANAPLSIRATKFIVDQLALAEADRDVAAMRELQADAASSEDFKEATRAFLEKRKPTFRGR